MMRWIVERSLRLRFVVVALALVLIVAGSRAARNTPLDVFPEFAPPLVEIQTEAPGSLHRRGREPGHGSA